MQTRFIVGEFAEVTLSCLQDFIMKLTLTVNKLRIRSRENFHGMISYDFKCNLTAQQSLAWLRTTFGDEALCKTIIYNRFAKFKRSHVNLGDEFHNGCPSTSVNNKNIDACCAYQLGFIPVNSRAENSREIVGLCFREIKYEKSRELEKSCTYIEIKTPFVVLRGGAGQSAAAPFDLAASALRRRFYTFIRVSTLAKYSLHSSNTSGLVRHLAHVHKINTTKCGTLEESESEASTSSGVNAPKNSRPGYESTQQQKLNFKTPPIQSLGEILVRLAAKDGFTINAITKSEFICDSLSAKGYKLSMCVNDVMNLIIKYYEDKEKEMIKELSDLFFSQKLQLLGTPCIMMTNTAAPMKPDEN
ncbi:hypothetical protein EVAR_56766_1 [Eumeta japonica]|uniref:Uncharacterized protein n=1 Tax=Eumeta variegata TaxID=151549 RepID=A0A4C1XQ88_EUMVA|nr:hypothetical protein EVAR_56766_1 [Eumeta japonica]